MSVKPWVGLGWAAWLPWACVRLGMDCVAAARLAQLRPAAPSLNPAAPAARPRLPACSTLLSEVESGCEAPRPLSSPLEGVAALLRALRGAPAPSQ